jgi:hypothetical protein
MDARRAPERVFQAHLPDQRRKSVSIRGRPPLFREPQRTFSTGCRTIEGFCSNTVRLIDHAIILDVEATRAIRQAEVGAARTMIDRAEKRFGLYPEKLAADRAYGSAEMLGWLVHERGIEPHIPVFERRNLRTRGLHL